MARHLSILLLTTVSFTLCIAGDTYNALDIDNDGGINKIEASALPGLQERWSELDIDGNGKLSVEEFAGFEITDRKTSTTAPSFKE